MQCGLIHEGQSIGDMKNFKEELRLLQILNSSRKGENFVFFIDPPGLLTGIITEERSYIWKKKELCSQAQIIKCKKLLYIDFVCTFSGA